jgi:hypothetical protein
MKKKKLLCEELKAPVEFSDSTELVKKPDRTKFRGFGSMDEKRHREVSSKGGKHPKKKKEA